MRNYKDYQKLVYKMAWKMSKRTGMDVQEFISEFNLVYVESDQHFDEEMRVPFSSYLCGNIMRRFSNIMIHQSRLKNINMIAMDELPHALCYDLMDSILIRDSFFQSDDPVIFSIAELICGNTLPDGSLKIWLRKKLSEKGFLHKEITKAFSILRETFDPEGKC